MQASSNIPGANIHMLCMCEKFSQVYIKYFYDIEHIQWCSKVWVQSTKFSRLLIHIIFSHNTILTIAKKIQHEHEIANDYVL